MTKNKNLGLNLYKKKLVQLSLVIYFGEVLTTPLFRKKKHHSTYTIARNGVTSSKMVFFKLLHHMYSKNGVKTPYYGVISENGVNVDWGA